MLGKPFVFYGMDDDFQDMEKVSAQTQRIETLLAEGKTLAILLAVFDPCGKLYDGVLVEMLSESFPLRESKGRVAEARLLTLIHFTASVPVDTAAKAIGLGSSGGGDAYHAEWLTPRFRLVD
ncbi:hypothetical protein MPDQ_004822 [Monascus purpureus]|uniref:Uncharacterized protein n=1 Tax=Monascus purpureus TaxID=5098 RepID=A0A507QGV2_MONPU|nr:hypothetical protein MPDQ_004822 [Monascus purpureus]BDD60227.1 hypothetical protein MAP00_005373 [Monascus purpureus]